MSSSPKILHWQTKIYKERRCRFIDFGTTRRQKSFERSEAEREREPLQRLPPHKASITNRFSITKSCEISSKKYHSPHIHIGIGKTEKSHFLLVLGFNFLKVLSPPISKITFPSFYRKPTFFTISLF